MKIENQVCTLEQAKIFKDEFGLELDSYFVWLKWDEEFGLVTNTNHLQKNYEYYSAPNCAELGVLLPSYIDVEDSSPAFFTSSKDLTRFYSGYEQDDEFQTSHAFCSKDHEAHAKADLLIDGLRNGYIKPEDLKL